MTYEEVFSIYGLMPAIAKRADQLAYLCFDHGIDITISDYRKSKLGKTVALEKTNTPLIRLICLADVLCELAKSNKNGKINLDELVID